MATKKKAAKKKESAARARYRRIVEMETRWEARQAKKLGLKGFQPGASRNAEIKRRAAAAAAKKKSAKKKAGKKSGRKGSRKPAGARTRQKGYAH